MRICRQCCACFASLAIGSAVLSDIASAVNILWDGTGTSWNAVGSWSLVTNGPIPNPVAVPGAADLAIFNTTTVNTAQTVNLNGPQFARGLVFNSTGTVSIPLTNTLTLGTSGITVNAGAGADTISALVVLAGSQTWTNNSSNLLTVNGSVTSGAHLLTIAGAGNTTIADIHGIAGSGGLTKNGAGTLTLSNNNILTGDVTINAGALNANGNVTIEGGVFQRNSTSSFTLAAGKTMTIQNGGRASFNGEYSTAANGVYNIGGTNSKLETLNGGALHLNDGAQMNVDASGFLSLPGNLEIGGNGTSGTLSINGTNANVTQSGAGTLTVGHATTGEARINVGTTASGGTLTTGTGLFMFNDRGGITVGGLATSGTINANGNFTIDGGGMELFNPGSKFLLAAGKTFTIQNGGGANFFLAATLATPLPSTPSTTLPARTPNGSLRDRCRPC